MRNSKDANSCLIKRRALVVHTKGYAKYPDCFIGVPIINELNENPKVLDAGFINNSNYQPIEGA